MLQTPLSPIQRLKAAVKATTELTPAQLAASSSRISAATTMLEFLADGHNKGLRSITEVSRKAAAQEPQRISVGEAAVIIKASKWELDQKDLGLTPENLLRHYEREGVDPKPIIDSDRAQSEAKSLVKRLFPAKNIINWEDLTPAAVARYKLIFALGGDDTMKYVAHSVEDQYFIGVNSDRKHSQGAILQIYAEDLPKTLQSLAEGEFTIQEWARLKATVNGVEYRPALSEISIMEELAVYTTRINMVYAGGLKPIKGSGLIVATGAGSSGWFRSGTRYLFHGSQLWNKTSEHAEWAVREPYGDIDLDDVHGILDGGSELVIRSGMSHHGIVDIDSVTQIPFPRGAEARISFAKPLKVVIPRL